MKYTSALFLLLATSLLAAPPTLTVQISNETAPPGATVQFKISPTAPALISTAGVSMTFDPAIFGPIANVTAFSATGDQVGYAQVTGQQLTANFSSASASLGQLPALPFLVVTIPVLPTAKIAATSSITIDPTPSAWQDQQGNAYAVTVNPGTFTVGGTLSIQSVTPGGGLLPAGTIVSIDGTGFDASTTITIDGVSLSSTQFVSTQQINLTIGGAIELTGKHLHVQTGAGAQSDFFCALPSAPANAASNIFPLLPLTTYTNATWQRPDDPDYQESIVLLNQNLSPVTVTLFSAGATQALTISPPVTIPPGELYTIPTTIGLGPIYMLSSAPIRMIEYRVNLPLTPPYLSQSSVFPPTPLVLPTFLLEPNAYPSVVAWNWQIGTAAPSPIIVDLTGALPLTTTISNAPWLSASPAQGSYPETFVLTPNVSALGAGMYSGSVTIHPFLPAPLSALALQDIVIPVSIQVSASPFIAASGMDYFTATIGSTTPQTGTIAVTTNGAPAQFSVTANASWLAATPSTGTTPSSINLTVNPSGLALGTYMANVVIQGPANAVTIPVEFQIVPPSMTGPIPLTANPTSLTFALAAGAAGAQAPQLVFVQPTFNFTISVQPQSGGNWLAATFIGGVSVTATAVGLNPGTYQGTITLTSTTNGFVQIPVTLLVLAPSAPLTVSPTSVALTVQAGQNATQTFTVTSNPSTLFQVSGGSANSPYTPATVQVGFDTTQPGLHYSSVTFTSGAGSVTIPVVVNVTASSTFPPILASIVNAASASPSAIAPGEIITLYGTGLAPPILINNIAAQVLYASSGQVNVIVPSEIGTTGTAMVQSWSIPLAPSAPGIFTLSGSGAGPAAIVNQDGSINSASNPAPRGTAIEIYLTGGNPALPVTVTIGGINAQVLYTGANQINAIIPQAATPGAAPIVVTVGTASSQSGVTVSIS